MSKSERIRDPVHNIIGFAGGDLFEETMWRVIQTRPFQRLRRIKQLGFSELVFPGATHTRFAHSVGVFHMSRSLMAIIRNGMKARKQTYQRREAEVSLAAALVHDVGHGMFSHAFERFGDHFQLPMADHEHVSDLLIRDDEIRNAFKSMGGFSFADEVAAVIKAKQPDSLYAAVVSSQFDADRLDYMQRDRLMTGVQSSDVDVAWLLANLEVGEVPSGSDDISLGPVETLVFGPKARETAESYVVALLHLYQNVYGHKATRGAETTFFALMSQLMKLYKDDALQMSNLPGNHPLCRFLKDPTSIGNVLALDDAVFWGALPLLADAEDGTTKTLAIRLRDRRLPRSIDIRRKVEEAMPPDRREETSTRKARLARIDLACGNIRSRLEEKWQDQPIAARPALLDSYTRSPYRRFDAGRSPVSQMYMRLGEKTHDLAELSSVVAGAEPLQILRAYDFSDDGSGTSEVVNEIRTELGGVS